MLYFHAPFTYDNFPIAIKLMQINFLQSSTYTIFVPQLDDLVCLIVETYN